jgi:hypothetical protein
MLTTTGTDRRRRSFLYVSILVLISNYANDVGVIMRKHLRKFFLSSRSFSSVGGVYIISSRSFSSVGGLYKIQLSVRTSVNNSDLQNLDSLEFFFP